MYQEKSLERLNQLIEQGRTVRARVRHPGPGVICESWVDDESFFQWKTSSLNCLKLVFSEKGTHFLEFQKNCRGTGISNVDSGIGILLAAKADIECGFLKQIESVVSADIFTDFIEMATYLNNEGYHIAAASISGAVLEDSLKKICILNSLEIKKSDGLFHLNEKLHSNSIYNKIVWKSVDTWREIRNAADHGDFKEVHPDNVKSMVIGISDFLGKHLI